MTDVLCIKVNQMGPHLYTLSTWFLPIDHLLVSQTIWIPGHKWVLCLLTHLRRT